MNPPAQSEVIEHVIDVPGGTVRAYERPGADPAVVMTHGFPDDSRIYMKLTPELVGRRVVTFDFLGHGRSGRQAAWPMAAGQREDELGAVITALHLDKPVLVGHDIGGPVVIRYALARPGEVGGLVLLNTFFGDSDSQEFPEFIRMLADPHLKPLVDQVVSDPDILGWVLLFTNSRLNPGPPDLEGVGGVSILPQFFGGSDQPDSLSAIRAWTARLFPEVAEQNRQVAAGETARLDVPVAIAFGENDPFFNAGVAQHLHRLFAGSTVETVPDAAHWPQWDQPSRTAAVIHRLVERAESSTPSPVSR